MQRRIFIFEALDCFKLGAPLEGLRRLMSYKLALHVHVTFTEHVVPIYKHVASFWIPSISGTKQWNSHSETNEKGSGEAIWPHWHSVVDL